MLTEFALIDRVRKRIAHRNHVVLGIGDDAAIVRVPDKQELAITMDTLHSGVHFPPETLPYDIGWKTLAVNLSDLAAMGAKPSWCTLSLSLPHSNVYWLDAFLDGFFAVADAWQLALVGGDTTCSALSTTVTAMGIIPYGKALRRSGAHIGDEIWVTGCPGEAAAALWLWRHKKLCIAETAPQSHCETVRTRLLRPVPRIAEGVGLRNLASAAIDISDGLIADLGHICSQSGVGAEIDVEALPFTSAHMLGVSPQQVASWQLCGGDDYELCFTAPAVNHTAITALFAQLATKVTPIGRITSHAGIDVSTQNGTPWDGQTAGYTHFSTPILS